jgi:hypothetical protein
MSKYAKYAGVCNICKICKKTSKYAKIAYFMQMHIVPVSSHHLRKANRGTKALHYCKSMPFTPFFYARKYSISIRQI